MKCPVDSTPMSGGVQGGMRYEACPHCRGLWVNAATLAAASPPVFVLFKNLPGIEPVEEDGAGPRACHDCGLTLVSRDVNGTTIDICPRCSNIWLGAGEFDRVAEFYRSRPRNEWPHASQLEAHPVLPGPERDRSGLPKGARARVGVAFGEEPTEPIDPADRMKRAIKLIGELVDKGLTE